MITSDDEQVIGDAGSDDNENIELFDAQYDLPTEQSPQYVDESTGQLVDSKDLTDFQKIKIIAQQLGIEIKKPNPGCKKCYGRGYKGKIKDTGEPVFCRCILVDKKTNNSSSNGDLNREQRRKMQKQMRRRIKKINMKKLIKEVDREQQKTTE